MLEPMDKKIPLSSGGEKSFVLSKFPAIAGREIVTQYPTTGMPKLGEYKTNEEIMLKLMAFVGVRQDNGGVTMLTTRELVNNHVPDFEALMRIEWAMMEYNCSFFRNGAASGLLTGWSAKVQALISSTLTGLLQQSSPKEKPSTKS